jgi:hypothetical protein
MQAIKNFCREIGITRSDNEIHLHKLEHHIRADLDATSPRVLAVLHPLRLVLTNLPSDHFQTFDAKARSHRCHIPNLGCSAMLRWTSSGLHRRIIPSSGSDALLRVCSTVLFKTSAQQALCAWLSVLAAPLWSCCVARASCHAMLCLLMLMPGQQVFPGRSEESYPVALTRVVYIEATDFREVDAKGYYGLAPNKSCMLK